MTFFMVDRVDSLGSFMINAMVVYALLKTIHDKIMFYCPSNEMGLRKW